MSTTSTEEEPPPSSVPPGPPPGVGIHLKGASGCFVFGFDDDSGDLSVEIADGQLLAFAELPSDQAPVARLVASPEVIMRYLTGDVDLRFLVNHAQDIQVVNWWKLSTLELVFSWWRRRAPETGPG